MRTEGGTGDVGEVEQKTKQNNSNENQNDGRLHWHSEMQTGISAAARGDWLRSRRCYCVLAVSEVEIDRCATNHFSLPDHDGP